MSLSSLLNELPKHLREQLDNGDIIMRMISVKSDRMEVLMQKALSEGWTPIAAHAEGDNAWAILVTPTTQQNGDG